MNQATNERAAFAEWLARQHLRFDNRLSEIIYLPVGAPQDEVRLVEVNTGLYPEPGSPITAIESTPAVTDLPFRVLVADVTPDEWTQIKGNPGLLPVGWNLAESRVFRRSR